jgi:hypothetical protein
MPRAKKNKQMEIAPNSTNYGERQELEQMQSQMARASVDPMALQQTATNTAAAMPPPMPPGGFLNQPTERPNEPITAGLDIGAGPGREALGMPPARNEKIHRQLQQAAETSGNPILQRMAAQVGQRPRPRPPAPRIHR